MHLNRAFVVLLFGLLALGSPQFALAQTEPVNIPDAQLRSLIEGLLSKTPGAVITRAEMQFVPYILGAGRNISDLTGLEYATNVQQAFLDRNRIGNILPLASMTSLQRLVLGNNQISNLTPLASLSVLQELYLGNNRISNLTPLTNLTNLTQLDLRENSVSELSPLTNLTNLTRLYLQGNSITDISALVLNTGLGSGDQVDLRGNPLNETSFQQHIPALQLRGVTVTVPTRLSGSNNIPDANLRAALQAEGIATSYDVSRLKVFQAPNAGIANLAGLESATTLERLNLDGNAISDLTPLASFLQLTELKLNSNRISDLTPLNGLVRLTELELNNNSISDLAPLASLNQLAALSGMGLTKLKLNGNSIANISHVTNMTSLIDLDLGSNYISNLAPLASLTGLTRLNLSDNYISDLAPLASLTGLTRLNLSDNRISGLTPLARLTGLAELDLGSNYVSDLKPLAALRGLIALQLNNNRISDISPVTDMASLIDLDLSDNHLSDLAALADLTALVRLWLNGNSISDIAPLLRNQGLNGGDQIDLHSNFLSDESNRIHLGALRNRGVSVVNDTAISVAEMASALEGEDIEFQVSLSAAVEFDIEIIWDISTLDAKEIEDFRKEDATGALSINALDTEGIIVVRTTEDDLSELDETFDLFINFPLHRSLPVWVTLNSTLGTGTIIDDDRPVASATVPNQKLTAGSDALELELSSLFSAPGELAYEAVSSDASLAKIKIAGGLLILRPEEAGVVTITITATDSAGFKATQTFMVTIDPTTPRSRLRGWRLGLLTGEREAQHQESDP